MSERFGVVLPAAGSGNRFGGDKLFYEIDGRPLLWYTLCAFQAARTVQSIVIVTRKDRIPSVTALSSEFSKVISVVPGGNDRQSSVACGVAVLPEKTTFVSIHDAARPLITPEEIDRLHEIAAGSGAVCMCGPVNDTIHETDADGNIIATPDRSRLVAAQTPQVFPLALYRDLCRREKKQIFTDDAAFACSAGITVKTVRCKCENFKVTEPEDALRAAAVLHRRSAEKR